MIHIRPLLPQDAEAFVQFLSTMDYHHAPQWSGCFCQFYHTACSMDEWTARDSDQNRQATLAAISQGTMKGFLAFEADRIVGWLNANHVSAYPRLHPFVDAYVHSPSTVAVVCFVIDPAYRGKGIATRLLRTAVQTYIRNGISEILGFPFEDPDHPQRAYHGTLSMYIKAGFTQIETRGHQHIVVHDSSKTP